MRETWKDIKDFEGIYQISTLGRVKRNKRKTRDGRNLKEKYMRPYTDWNGYFKVTLTNKKVTKHFFVHRLVANAFIPNPNDLSQINHKDENKQNNCVDNLEWCTRLYNMNYGSTQEKKAKKSRKQVNQYDLNGIFIKKWNSIKEASNSLGINHANISSCCKNKYGRRSSGGFMWKYVKEVD